MGRYVRIDFLFVKFSDFFFFGWQQILQNCTNMFSIWRKIMMMVMITEKGMKMDMKMDMKIDTKKQGLQQRRGIAFWCGVRK